MKEHLPEYLDRIFQDIIKIDICKEVEKPEEDMILHIIGDDDINDYVLGMIDNIKNAKLQLEKEVKKKKKLLKTLESVKEKYETGYDKISENIREKVENNIKKIPNIETDVRMLENQLMYHPPNFVVQDVITYSLNNGKVGILEFEYKGDTISLQEFVNVDSIRKQVHLML